MFSHSRLSRTATWCAAAAFAALGLPVAVGAQGYGDDAPHPVIGNIGLHGGLVKARDAEDGKFQGGLHLELTPLRILGIQGAVDYRTEEKFNFTVGTTNADVAVRTLPITLSGKLYIPVMPQFAPYGLVGAGWYHQKVDFSQDLENLGFRDQKDTTFGWHAGVGAAANLTPRFGLFGEARWIFLDPDRDLDPATQDRVEDFDYNSSHLLAGVNFFF